jgi:hypothetical protein
MWKPPYRNFHGGGKTPQINLRIQVGEDRWKPFSIPTKLLIDQVELVDQLRSLGLEISPGNTARILRYLIHEAFFADTWPKARRLLSALLQNPGGLTRLEIYSKVFSRNLDSWVITDVLDNLYALGLVRFHIQRTAGRPATRWTLSSLALKRRAQAAAGLNPDAINV